MILAIVLLPEDIEDLLLQDIDQSGLILESLANLFNLFVNELVLVISELILLGNVLIEEHASLLLHGRLHFLLLLLNGHEQDILELRHSSELSVLHDVRHHRVFQLNRNHALVLQNSLVHLASLLSVLPHIRYIIQSKGVLLIHHFILQVFDFIMEVGVFRSDLVELVESEVVETHCCGAASIDCYLVSEEEGPVVEDGASVETVYDELPSVLEVHVDLHHSVLDDEHLVCFLVHLKND